MRTKNTVNADEAWLWALENLSLFSEPTCEPRGLPIYEQLGVGLSYPVSEAVVCASDRNLSYEFMISEALWILKGRNDVASVAPYAPKIAQFSDNGSTFRGAYGPEIQIQLEYILSCLSSDLDTRQATLTIWRKNPGKSKDIPCTVAMSFYIRYGLMYSMVFMRSSDVWLGLPYDMFNFAMITRKICDDFNKLTTTQLRVEYGFVNLFIGSSHLYKSDLKRARRVVSKVDSARELSVKGRSLSIRLNNQANDTESILESCLLHYEDL